MQQKPQTARRAFTMVELAVVIAIIALLVGGIASMRSFSKNSELNTLINESKILTSAFSQFQTRYGAPPGDFITASSLWTGAGNGDGNGLIRATAAAPGNRAEWFYTFQHLAFAGFIQGTYTGATTGGGGTFYAKIGTNVVGSSMLNTAFLFDNPDFTDTSPDGFLSGDAIYFDGQYSNVLIIAGLNDNATSIPDQAFLTPKDALQIDLKFDDGAPGRGNIMTPENTALPNCADSDTASSAVYNVTTSPDTKTCYLILKMQ